MDRLDECVDFGDLVVCTQGTIVSETVMTPSGQLVGIVHVDYVNTYDYTEGTGCDTTQPVKYQDVSRFDTDEAWELEGAAYVARSELRFQCASGNYACEDRVMGHFANGTFQFIRNESVCEEVT